jgi:hypothetical protein
MIQLEVNMVTRCAIAINFSRVFKVVLNLGCTSLPLVHEPSVSSPVRVRVSSRTQCGQSTSRAAEANLAD